MEKTIPVNNGFLDLIVKKQFPSKRVILQWKKRLSKPTEFFSWRTERYLIGQSNSEGSSRKKQSQSFNQHNTMIQIEMVVIDELSCIAYNRAKR